MHPTPPQKRTRIKAKARRRKRSTAERRNVKKAIAAHKKQAALNQQRAAKLNRSVYRRPLDYYVSKRKVRPNLFSRFWGWTKRVLGINPTPATQLADQGKIKRSRFGRRKARIRAQSQNAQQTPDKLQRHEQAAAQRHSK